MIRMYRELKSKNGLLPLMDQAFGWSFSELDFEKWVKFDPRLRNSPIGFCEERDGRLVGYVGVMDMSTRTLNGTLESVGGIYGVATLPSHVRQGICTELMSRAHEYFREKGYCFAFLTTSPTIVAYDFYRKLGYLDVSSFQGAYKMTKEKKEKPSVRKSSKLDLGRMLQIYREYARGKIGFVVRDQTYMKMLKEINELTNRQCIITRKGYVIFKEEKNVLRIRELIATDLEEMNELIDAMEQRAKNVLLCRAVQDPVLRRVYADRGFNVLDEGHGVLMAKPLASDVSFKEMYGDGFFMTSLDHF